MLKRYKLLLFLALLGSGLKAQVNLVPNPSFEIHDTCPNAPAQVKFAVPWFQPTLGSSDLFDSCDNTQLVAVPTNFEGYQYPAHGNAYAGLVAYNDSAYLYREYIEIKLNATLSTATKYYVAFYVSLGDSSREGIDQLGCYFSNDTIKDPGYLNLNYTPQISNANFNYLSDKQNWTKISGSFMAQGNENYLTIGNFRDSANTNAVFVPGGSSSLSARYAYYYVDYVCVSTDSLTCNSSISVKENWLGNPVDVYPNPTSGDINVVIASDMLFRVYDSHGNKVIDRSLSKGNNLLDIHNLDSGFYFFELEEKNHSVIRKKIVKK